MKLTMPGFRLHLDLYADGKPISRPQYWTHQSHIITNQKLGYELFWEIPHQAEAWNGFQASLMGLCLVDEHWLWGLLGLRTFDGQPVCYRQPWQCYIHQDDEGKKVPGTVDRLIPGLWMGPDNRSAVQVPLMALSYVVGKVSTVD